MPGTANTEPNPKFETPKQQYADYRISLGPMDGKEEDVHDVFVQSFLEDDVAFGPTANESNVIDIPDARRYDKCL